MKKIAALFHDPSPQITAFLSCFPLSGGSNDQEI